jgi:hypothetical protein
LHRAAAKVRGVPSGQPSAFRFLSRKYAANFYRKERKDSQGGEISESPQVTGR